MSAPGEYEAMLEMLELPPLDYDKFKKMLEVPYSSYDEFEEMLECLIVKYGNMFCLQSDSVWLESGLGLILNHTKGSASTWCEWGCNMPLVFYIQLSLADWKIQRVADGATMDDETKHEFLRGLTRKQLLETFQDPSSQFMASNFLQVCSNGDKISIAQWREMQLAFCMVNHGRLRSGASGSVLGCDVLKLILKQVIE